MRNLYVVAKDNVLKFSGITDYAVCADDGIASDESAVSYLGLRSDDRRSLDISGIKYHSALGDPDILSPLLVNLGIKRRPDLENEFLYKRKNFPGILLAFEKRSRNGMAQIDKFICFKHNLSSVKCVFIA
jgi:hypothetical protein